MYNRTRNSPSFVIIPTLAATPASPIYWQPASAGLASDVQALVAVPTALYAGAWGQGVYRTDDHGATWITATLGLTLPMYVKGGLAVNPVTSTVLFAGDTCDMLSGVGVYRSTNGGISWTVSLRDVSVETLLDHPLTLV